jgi:hypothetical protein
MAARHLYHELSIIRELIEHTETCEDCKEYQETNLSSASVLIRCEEVERILNTPPLADLESGE